MKVIKILNNNALLTVDERGVEYVYMAKGIGFQNKVDSPFIDVEGQKQYKLSTGEKKKDISEQIDIQYVEVSAEILATAQKKFPQVNENILLPLADHIAFAIHRLKQNIEITNPFVADIKLLFPDEFALAQQGGKLIEDRFGITVSEDEVSYITLHIHSAITAEHIDLSLQIVSLIKDFVSNIEKECDLSINYDSITYTRFVTHIKFMVSRIFHDETINLDMNEYTLNNFPYSHKKAIILAHSMEKILKTNIKDVEIGYLALHIERVISSITEHENEKT